MKEIDTDSPVLWPAWCYSGNLSETSIFSKGLSKASKLLGNVEQARKALTPQPQKHENVSNISKNNSNTICNGKSLEEIVLHKLPLKRKFNHSSLDQYPVAVLDTHLGTSDNYQSQALDTTDSINANNRKKKRKRPNVTKFADSKMLNEQQSLLNSLENLTTAKKLVGERSTSISISPATSEIGDSYQATVSHSAAAALIYLDQAKHEARLDSPKDVIMESATEVANNNNISNSLSVRKNNNNNNSSSSSSSNKKNSLLYNQMQDLSVNQHQLMFNEGGNTKAMKRERLSPSANGDISSTFSRCRSATPSPTQNSLPHQPLLVMPMQTHIPVHNLSTNLLNSLQQAASLGCKSPQSAAATSNHPNATNYSDFMRSLAAKYNNNNPNEINTTRRGSFFDNANLPSSSKKLASSASQKPAISIISPTVHKEPTQISPLPLPPIASLSPADLAAVALKSQNVQNQMAAAAVAAAGVSPFMTSLFSSLPFSQGVLTPWIDMSNTQALLVLSRAAKEAKIEKAMRSMQSPKRSYSSASSSPGPNNNLNAALQQAAQLISPAMIYSAQAANVQNHVSRQPSPAPKRNTDTASERVPGPSLSLPLDLSSQPPEHKRFKAESVSSRSSMEELTNIVTSGLHRTSLAITTPSPPLSEKNVVLRPGSSASAEKKVSVALDGRHNTKILPSLSMGRQCQAQSEEVNEWSIEDVCAFVGSIDICAEYVQNFRTQQIDGAGLPLLTEDHLVNWLGMKLGPALKLRSLLAKKLGGPCPCVACVAQSQQILALHQQQQQQQQQQQTQHSDDGATKTIAKANTVESRVSSPAQQFKREDQSSNIYNNSNSNSNNNNNNDNTSDGSPSSNNDNTLSTLTHNSSNNNNNNNNCNLNNLNSVCKNAFLNNNNIRNEEKNNNNNNRRAESTETSS